MARQFYPSFRDLSELCPVPDNVFTLIHRATPTEAIAIAKLLPDVQRAKLAFFCYARAHLRECGRAIATACSEEDLVREGGIVAHAIIAQRSLLAVAQKAGSKITLASPATQQQVFMMVDCDDDEEAA